MLFSPYVVASRRRSITFVYNLPLPLCNTRRVCIIREKILSRLFFMCVGGARMYIGVECVNELVNVTMYFHG